MKSIFIFIAVLLGALLPFQVVFNTQLSVILKHPFLAAFVNVFTAFIFMTTILLLVRPEFPSVKLIQTVPWHLFTPGIIGATFVIVTILLLPKIGAANSLMAMVVGQLLISITIDHFGMFNVPEINVSVTRIIGALLLLSGLYLIQYVSN